MVYFLSFFFLINWWSPYLKTNIDPKLEPYYNEYIGIVKQYCKDNQYNHPDFKLVFGKMRRNEIGYCQISPNSFKIIIDKKYFKEANEDHRFSTIAHEFSHCNFEIPHFNSPQHYMYYADTNIPKAMVIYQLKEILKYKCNKD